MDESPAGEHVGTFEWVRTLDQTNLKGASLDKHGNPDATPKVMRLVGLRLAMFADGDTGSNARPGVDQLAYYLDIGERTVRRALHGLESAGLIKCTYKGSAAGRKGHADVYQLTRPADPTARARPPFQPAKAGPAPVDK